MATAVTQTRATRAKASAWETFPRLASRPFAAQHQHESGRGEAQPLDAGTRAYFEPRFGHDFSRVRVHSDHSAATSASAVGALAYTVEQHVVISDGRFSPASEQGRRLFAHELTHVVQQSGERARVQRQTDLDGDMGQDGATPSNGASLDSTTPSNDSGQDASTSSNGADQNAPTPPDTVCKLKIFSLQGTIGNCNEMTPVNICPLNQCCKAPFKFSVMADSSSTYAYLGSCTDQPFDTRMNFDPGPGWLPTCNFFKSPINNQYVFATQVICEKPIS